MDWVTAFDRQAADCLPDVKILAEEPMAKHTSFRVGGPARRMAFPQNGEQLVLLMEFARQAGVRPLLMGNGSNLLAPDGGLNRLVVKTTAMEHMEAGAEGTLTAEAGASLSRLAGFACRMGLSGLEFVNGIPGTLGGAVCMNAGAYGKQIGDVISSVTVLFPEEGIRTLVPEELHFAYRHSLLTEHSEAVILRAVLHLSAGEQEAIQSAMQDLMEKRRERQPLEYPSAGSTFKRPAGGYAGALIERCGLKGLTVGGAQVSEKHAGFIINRGGATCADVTELIRQVQERVFDQTGVRLEPEVCIVD